MKKLALLFIAILSLQLNLFAQLEFFNNNQEHNIFSEQSVASVNVNPDSLMLDSIITAYKTSESIPGISTMILKDNEVIWNNNYGYRNLQSQLPVEDSTFFLIGSISKTFVATSIMQLWQKGMIDLEKNINNYLPSGFKVANPYFPDDTITVKMLIVHTSSLQENWDVLTPLITCGDSPIKLDSFLINYLTPGGKYYSVNNFYNYRPGQKWNYTNVGYGLLALMVENLTGNTFDQYCRDSIFIPLSMNSSSWFLDGMDPNQIATPYQEGPICQQGFPNYPEGFLRTNKLEILNYLLAYMNYGIYNNVRILDSTTVAYMLSDQLGYPAVMELPWATYTQGLSWWLAFPINRSAWGRGGGWNGFLAYVSLEQTEKWVTIFFQNQKPLNTIVGKIGEINYPFTKYAHLYGNIYSLRPIVINPYAETNKDSVLFRTTFSNIYNHQFTPHLIYANSDSTEMDSLTLFDDGLHDDLLSNDGTYAGYIPPPQKNEDFYTISVSTIDNQTNKYFNTPNISGYTTAGPVVVDSLYSAFVPAQKRFSFKPYLKNLGNTLQINSPSVKVICNDSWVTNITSNNLVSASISPGQAVACAGFTSIYYDSTFVSHFNLKFEISSNGFVYWSMDTTVYVSPSAVDDETLSLITYNLEQNYPNPFNPVTTIKYQIPHRSNVSLKIYDIIGNEVADLINEEQEVGFYNIDFNAARLSSGVYFYRLQAGSFVQTRKMILLK